MTTADQWLDTAPAHWTRGRIKDLLSSATNGTWGSDPTQDGDNVRCVRAADFDRISRRADLSNAPLRYVEPSSLRQHLLRPGDLILEKSGGGEKQPVGMAVLFTGIDKAVCSNFCARIKPSANVDSRFLTYVFAVAYGQGLTEAAIKQTTGIQNLDTAALFTSRWAYPAQAEQRRIADFLDAHTAQIDRLRALTQRQIELVQERFGEQMRQWTTGKSDEEIETRVPWMPRVNAGWGLSRIGYEFRTSSGTTPTSSRADYFDGPYPWVNSSDIKDAPVLSSGKHVSAEALTDFSALKICRAGSLVVALYGQGTTKGRVGLLQMDAYLNQACCALTSLGRVSEKFAFYWFRAHKEGIVAQAVGAGQPNLSQETIRQLKIPVPDADTQHKIVTALSKKEEKLRTHSSLLQRRDTLLAECRQALITAAVTGQFDVSTASGRNVTEGVAV
ncbi:restriction endonuclease subunit S [Streptomyces sp. NK08204]|uniref:restriction endonuclease subunit S n=1 Tax=Streptomyces sp. NK08204 TaxID=2873260 RepID=UPI001CED486A|nr:restriction endonuclease subunit S [Streptomyces sp. NK08204]